MCLAVPGKVVNIYDDNGIRMGDVDFGGICKSICLAYIPNVQVNEYVLVHAGFALHQIDEEEVRTFHQLWQQVLEADNTKIGSTGDLGQ